MISDVQIRKSWKITCITQAFRHRFHCNQRKINSIREMKKWTSCWYHACNSTFQNHDVHCFDEEERTEKKCSIWTFLIASWTWSGATIFSKKKISSRRISNFVGEYWKFRLSKIPKFEKKVKIIHAMSEWQSWCAVQYLKFSLLCEMQLAWNFCAYLMFIFLDAFESLAAVCHYIPCIERNCLVFMRCSMR